MSLEQTINKDIAAQMKAKNKLALSALRAVKSAILLEKTKAGGKDQLTEEEELKLLQKLVKQRRDAAQLYKEQGREDLYEEEYGQLKIIEQYLPEQMDDQTLEAEIKKIIEQTGASSIKDMGRVMGMATKQFAGKADNGKIAAIVKKLLS